MFYCLGSDKVIIAMTQDQIKMLSNYCDEKNLTYDTFDDVFELIEDVTLNDIGRLVEYFRSEMKLNIQFVISGGVQYAFRITNKI